MEKKEGEEAAETILVSQTGEEKETQLPEGTLKEVGRRDQTCRPSKQNIHFSRARRV